MNNFIRFSILSILISTFLSSSFGQTSTINYDWGATTGKLTKTVKLIDGKRVLDGPLSYNGKDASPSTMTVKANYKKDLLDGPFSMSWVCPASDGFTFTAQGKFSQDSMDGVWNFVVKGAVNGQKTNSKISLTFKRGMLIQGDINDLINKSQEKFNCDKKGNLHGNWIWKGYEDGYLIEKKQVYVHGVNTIKHKKDVASGNFMQNPILLCDTSVVNIKNYSIVSNTFSKGDIIYEKVSSNELYADLFNSKFYLGYFKKEFYGGGIAPFIETSKIILPKEFEITQKK